MKMEIMGRTYLFTRYNIKHYVKYMKDVITALEKPFVVTYLGFPTIHLLSDSYEYQIHGIEDHLLKLTPKPTIANDFYTVINTIADEDKTWASQRNQETEYLLFQKYTLKKTVQEEALKTFNQIQLLLETISEILMAEEFKKTDVAKKPLYYLGKIYDERFIKEHGQPNILLDVDVVQRTGNTIRFILRSINEVGMYSYPYRLKGHHDIFDKSSWTEEEHQVSKWLLEFANSRYMALV